MPGVECGKTNGFVKNEVGSTLTGLTIFPSGADCLEFSDIKIYKTTNAI